MNDESTVAVHLLLKQRDARRKQKQFRTWGTVIVLLVVLSYGIAIYRLFSGFDSDTFLATLANKAQPLAAEVTAQLAVSGQAVVPLVFTAAMDALPAALERIQQRTNESIGAVTEKLHHNLLASREAIGKSVDKRIDLALKRHYLFLNKDDALRADLHRRLLRAFEDASEEVVRGAFALPAQEMDRLAAATSDLSYVATHTAFPYPAQPRMLVNMLGVIARKLTEERRAIIDALDRRIF
jgi:hypothetical protein